MQKSFRNIINDWWFNLGLVWSVRKDEGWNWSNITSSSFLYWVICEKCEKREFIVEGVICTWWDFACNVLNFCKYARREYVLQLLLGHTIFSFSLSELLYLTLYSSSTKEPENWLLYWQKFGQDCDKLVTNAIEGVWFNNRTHNCHQQMLLAWTKKRKRQKKKSFWTGKLVNKLTSSQVQANINNLV